MKKLLALIVLVLIVYIVLHRQRLFIRDPLASVTHDGTKENGVQVFINYSNDVLMENDNTPAYVLVLQHTNHGGTPAVLKCIHWLVCQTDADVATLLQARPDLIEENMGTKALTYRDSQGHETVVALR